MSRLYEVDKLTKDPVPRVHAHWILDGGKMIIVNKYKCSNCGNRSAEKDNYCSYCGSRMDESTD